MVAGLQTSYDFSTGVKVNMDEAIYMLSPMDAPLLTGFGLDGAQVLSSTSVDETTFYWMDEEALVPRSNLSAAATTGDTFITVTAGHQIRFSTGDMIVVFKAGGTERMRVTGYGSTANTLTVTRAYTGTATNYAGTEDIMILGTALPEGSDPENARSVDRSSAYNLTQIFGPTQVSISRSEQGRAKYGIGNEQAHQMMLRVQESVISREQAILYGVRSDSTTTKIRTMGGVDYYITSNVDATNTQITVAKVATNMLNCYDAGGLPTQLWANPHSLGDLNGENATIIRTTNVDTMRGTRRAEYFTTEYGDMTIVRSRLVHPTTAFGVMHEGITRRVFDPLVTTKLAVTGDSEDWMFVCEEGLEVKGQQHMFKMNALVY